MTVLRRVMWWLEIPLIVVVPAWMTVGRALLGSIGWFTVMMVWFVLPVVFLTQSASAVLLWLRSDATKARQMSEVEAGLSVTYVAAVGLFGLVMPDFGDVPGDSGSVLERQVGPGLDDALGPLVMGLGALVVATLILRLVASAVLLRR